MADDSRLLEDYIPQAWAPGLTRLCGIVPHTHGRRREDGTWEQVECPTPGKRPMGAGFNTVAAEAWKHPGLALVRLTEAQKFVDEGFNVGMVPPPTVAVIDCDTPATVEWMESIVLPGTPIMKRTESSAHFYVSVPSELMAVLKAKRIEWANDDVRYALDLRLPAKSQAVVPPSRHKSGVNYAWAVPLPERIEDVPSLPPELEELLRFHHIQRNAPRAERNADEIPGHDRIRSYANRWCRYLTDREQVRERARAYAAEVYAGREDRLVEVLAPGGEVDRIVDTGWERFGGQHPLDHDQTDRGFADLFEASSDNGWAYDPTSKVWYHHERGLWSSRESEWLGGAVGRLNEKMLDDAHREMADPGRRERLMNMHRKLRMTSKVTAVVKRLERDTSFRHSLLDRDPCLLMLGDDVDGEFTVFDTRTGQVREARKEDFLTRQMGSSLGVVGWDDEGLRAFDRIKEKWLKFLKETFVDPELIAYVHRAVGMTMLGEGKEHVLFFLYGRGGSGKSTFLNTLLAAFGTYAVKSGFETFVGDKGISGSAASPDIARLRGVRLVVCSEIPQRALLGARMKDLTGGDRLIGRELYGKPFEFDPRFSVWVAGNVAPEADFLDSGIERRLRVIPADHPCAKQDPTLLPTFTSEVGRAVVVAWAVEGLRAYREHGGLGSAGAVKEAQAEYWAQLNPVEEWFGEAYRRGPGEVGTTELYAEFLRWIEETHGLKASSSKVPTAQKFGKAMQRLGLSSIKGSRGKRYWRGLTPLERNNSVSAAKSVKLPDLQEK